jgi:peptidoglycan/xylan/chitin deacetylase (PgdA/CDA1 family)
MSVAGTPSSALRCIVTFHGIGAPGAGRPMEPGEDRYWITEASWHALLERLARCGDAEVTFDDGNVSDILAAAPALASRGMTATFFVVADRVDRAHFLSAAQVRELRSMGMRIGSHGMRHRAWKGLRGEALREEVVEAKDRLEQLLGEPVREAACPFGAYDRASLAALRAAGFSRVLTSDRGWARRGAWLQGRTSATRDDTAETFARVLRRPGPVRTARDAARTMVKRWM